jgi:hypothetical protein
MQSPYGTVLAPAFNGIIRGTNNRRPIAGC